MSALHYIALVTASAGILFLGMAIGYAIAPSNGPSKPTPNGCQHHGGFVWRQFDSSINVVYFGCKDGRAGTLSP